MVQFEPRNPLAIRKHSRLAEALQFTAIEKGLENILLDLLVACGDALQFLAQRSEVLHSLVDAVILFDIVGRCFDAEHVVVSRRSKHP